MRTVRPAGEKQPTHFTLLVEKISICTTGVSKESLRSHICRIAIICDLRHSLLLLPRCIIYYFFVNRPNLFLGIPWESPNFFRFYGPPPLPTPKKAVVSWIWLHLAFLVFCLFSSLNNSKTMKFLQKVIYTFFLANFLNFQKKLIPRSFEQIK